MSIKFSTSKNLTEMGNDIIGEHHKHLTGVRVDFIFRDSTPVVGGKEIWAKAKKITGLPAFLADTDGPESPEFFVIEVSGPVWAKLDDETRRALIDHELCHCFADHADPDDPDSDAKLSVRSHDLEEFREIIERHGLWRPDVEAMAATMDSVLET